MPQLRPITNFLFASMLATAVDAIAAASTEPDRNWATGSGVSMGGVLFPHLHVNGVYGKSSGDDGTLAVAHHDPASEGFTLNLEGGFSLRAGDHFEGFTTYALRWDEEERTWEHEFEEWFLKAKNLPGGFDLRVGQYLNRFGLQNTYHNHGWDFVDQNLVSGRFLGDDGMGTQGGELTWKLPFDSLTYTSLLSLSVGQAVPHEEEEEVSEGPESAYEPHAAAFTGPLMAVNWTNLYRVNDFHSLRAGASYARGENEWGRHSNIYGTHLEYQWKANGLEAGGNYFRWRTELMLRDLQAVATESKQTRSLSEWGVSSSLIYGLATMKAGRFEPGLRFDYVQGIAAAELDERWRLSPSLTWNPLPSRTLSFRLQYNLDHSPTLGTSHGLWAQVLINWGDSEIR
jgi:hypothetical protein